MSHLKITHLKIMKHNSILLEVPHFEWREGEKIFLEGPSGSGKSLFLKAIIGIIPCTYETFSWNSKNILLTDFYKLRKHILHVPQHPTLAPHITTGKQWIQLIQSYELHKKTPWNYQAAQLFLNAVDRKTDFLEKEAEHLSGGEKQLLQIYATILLSPKLMLLDESLSAMDLETRSHCIEFLDHWMTQAKIGLIFTGHLPLKEGPHYDKIAQVREGKLLV